MEWFHRAKFLGGLRKINGGNWVLIPPPSHEDQNILDKTKRLQSKSPFVDFTEHVFDSLKLMIVNPFVNYDYRKR